MKKYSLQLCLFGLAISASFSLMAIEIRSVERAIPDSYIIVLESEVDHTGERKSTVDVEKTAVELAVRYGLEVEFVYEHALKGFAVRADARAIQQLASSRDARIEFIEQDSVVSLDATQNNATWGLDRIDQRDRPLNGSYVYDVTASNVRAYIIDSGIRASHSDFGGRVLSGYTAINDGRGTNDCNGHGTHVAGTVGGATWGVAKSVRLVPVRVFGCTGGSSNSIILAGINWVAANAVRPAVANMSLGGGASSTTDSATNNLINSGVTVVVAAGNSGANACNYSPARVANAITVGSTTSSDARSNFSNYGSCVNVFAPGSSIRSAWYTSNTATNTISGTSMASPHVAGVAALYLSQNTGASNNQVFNAIVSNATTGRLSGIGSGSPNRMVYSRFGSGGGGAPCSGCESYTGSLSGTGAQQQQPNGTYYYSGSGQHRGYLRGPSNANFNLYLFRWNGSGWSQVASSTGSSSSEDLVYNGSAGYYTWLIHSASGGGSYTFYLDRP